MSPAARWLVASFALALVIRVIDVLVVGPVRTPDTAGYGAAALALRQSLFARDAALYTRAPLYAVLIALAPSDGALVACQAIASAAIAPLVGAATARHLGTGAGVAAALGVVLMPPFVEWTPYVLTDILALALLAIAMERTSAALAGVRSRDSALAGAVGALAFLARPAYTAALAALALATLLRRGGWGRHPAAIAPAAAAVF